MRTPLLLSLFIASIISCRKDAAIPEGVVYNGNVTSNNPMYPLKTGTFWVYDFYKIDTAGVESYLAGNDTVKIIKDSIVNGNKYAVFKGSYEGFSNNIFFRRDSSGYLVDEAGGIYCSFTNFTDTFYTNLGGPNWINIFIKMSHKDSIITVPAGTFVTSMLDIIQYFPSTFPYGHPAHIGPFYSKGVGVIKYRTHGPLPDYLESRLVNYYIAP